MDIIEQLNPVGFTEYLRKYGNTICGRHPIGVLLNVIVYFSILLTVQYLSQPQTQS
jgi:predicted class III extradiol MEMO1 family dioxygenase